MRRMKKPVINNVQHTLSDKIVHIINDIEERYLAIENDKKNLITETPDLRN